MNADVGLVCLAAGREEYALRDADVRRIARVEQMQTDSASDGRLGTLMIGRHRAPVHQLARVFGAPTTARIGRHIVVTDGPGGPNGWIVDRIRRAQVRADRALVRLPSLVGPLASTWFEGLVESENRALLLISPRSLEPAGEPATPPLGCPPPEQIACATPTVSPRTSPLVVMFSTPSLPICEGACYGLSARQVVAVVPALSATRVPGSPPHVAGVATRDREAICVVDVCSGNEPTTRRGREPRHLLARTGPQWQGQAVAFAVNPTVTLHRPTGEDREHPGRGAKPPFVAGFFGVAGTSVALLDLDVLVGGGYPGAG